MERNMEKIMEKFSTTFYSCMESFPTEIREDIYKLYAYLRVVDEMVEGDYGDECEFGEWRRVVDNFYEVSDKYQFEGQWLLDFHNAMLTDLIRKEHTLVSMLEYCKGSAEAVGLMMSRILGCPPHADNHARALGRAYQIINFIRDYEEDTAKGYKYITESFDFYLQLFYEAIDEGMDGLHFIPEELQEPIIQATKGYMEIANELY